MKPNINKIRKYSINIIAFLLLLGAIINSVLAAAEEQWPNTTSPAPQIVNNDPGTNEQASPRITLASDGNYIISWFDERNSGDLYIQKVAATDGSKLWNSGSDVAVSTNTNFIPEQNVWRYDNHAIVADNSGGAFVIWDTSDNPNTLSDIYAQHFNSSGVAQWAANGVKIEAGATAATQFEHVPFAVSDGNGFFIAWSAMDSGFANMTAHAARIDSTGGIDATWNSGNILTLPSGVSSYNSATGIISDGSGGIIVSYVSTDMGASGDAIGARISSTGILDTNWNSGNGVVFDDAGDITATSSFPTRIRITSDGSGGMLGVYLSGPSTVKVQGINASGNLKFGSASIISNNTNASNIHLTSDGSGGAIIAWTDRSAPPGDIRTQRINSSGAIQWPDGAPAIEGNILATGELFMTNYLGTPIVPGSAIIGYISDTTETPFGTKIDNTGTEEWGAGGINIGGGSFYNIGVDVASDGNGGAAFAWSAYNAGNIEIFTQYIQDPPPGPAPDAITDLAAIGGNGNATLSWTAPNDNGSAITSYTVEYGTVSGGVFDQTCIDASCTDTTPGATVPGLDNFTAYQFQVIATNANDDSPSSNTATITPTQCSPLDDNDDAGGPTVSQNCIGVVITAGTISVENVPDSLIFPSKYSTSINQDSFSNDNSGTVPVDITTADDDILTVADLRNSGGFDLTITSTTFYNDTDTIPLENLYIASTYPEDDDLTPIDSNLIGTEVNGIEFASGSTNTGNITTTSMIHSDDATGTPTNGTEYTTLKNAYINDGSAMDTNGDDTAESITLMESTGARIARMSQALGFYLDIPGSQTSGTYKLKFTITLTPN